MGLGLSLKNLTHAVSPGYLRALPSPSMRSLQRSEAISPTRTCQIAQHEGHPVARAVAPLAHHRCEAPNSASEGTRACFTETSYFKLFRCEV